MNLITSVSVQALVPVHIGAENEGLIIVRGHDLRRFLASAQKTNQRLDAQGLHRCFVRTGAAW